MDYSAVLRSNILKLGGCLQLILTHNPVGYPPLKFVGFTKYIFTHISASRCDIDKNPACLYIPASTIFSLPEIIIYSGFPFLLSFFIC